MISRRLLRIKVLKALYSHMQAEGESLIASQKNLLFSINKSYELYHLLLRLVVDVAQYGEQLINQRKSKLLPSEGDLNPNCRFIRNRAIEQLRRSEALNNFLTKNSLSWSAYPELIRKLYNNMIGKEYYTRYMNAETCRYYDDKAFVVDFFSNEIEDFQDLYDIIEEMSIFWIDEIEFITSQVIKTVVHIKASDVITDPKQDLPIASLVKDPEDLDFAKQLFIRSLVDYKENISYLESFVENWDIDRIAFMDKILVLMALIEVREFPNIPIRVTLDEYIEIAKYYSSLSSGNFVNGILDRIVGELKKSGKINKTI